MRSSLSLVGLALLLIGCPGADKGAGTEGGGTTTSSTTTGGTGDPTTGDACEETTGEPVFHDELCDPFCQRMTECELEGIYDGCPCYGLLTGAKCLAAWDAAVKCFAAESCATLQTGEGACWDQFDAAYERCEYGECGCLGYEELGGDIGPDECIIGEDCLDTPSRRLECDAETCTCTVDGAPAVTCPADGACDIAEYPPLRAKLDACCG